MGIQKPVYGQQQNTKAIVSAALAPNNVKTQL